MNMKNELDSASEAADKCLRKIFINAPNQVEKRKCGFFQSVLKACKRIAQIIIK